MTQSFKDRAARAVRTAIGVSAALLAWCLSVASANAQPGDTPLVRRATSVEDLVQFARVNYFDGIDVDARRAREIDRVVRAYKDSIDRIQGIPNKNAKLPDRQRALRALLRTAEERARFDENVRRKRLP